MQSTSESYRWIISNDNHWFETKVVINDVTYTEESIFSLSTSFSLFDKSPEVGTATAGEIDVEMLKPPVDIPRMAEIKPFVRGVAEQANWILVDDCIVFQDGVSIVDGVLVFSEESGASIVDSILVLPSDKQIVFSEWIQQGVFFVDTREYTKNESGNDVLIINGFDAMLKAEQPFESDVITGDSTDEEMVDEIARIIGVEVDSRTYDMMGHSYTIPLPTGYTCREVLGYIAGMYVGSFVMTDVGKLRLVSLLELPPETNYLVTENLDAIVFGEDRILV